jgi:hypothetical protein
VSTLEKSDFVILYSAPSITLLNSLNVVFFWPLATRVHTAPGDPTPLPLLTLLHMFNNDDLMLCSPGTHVRESASIIFSTPRASVSTLSAGLLSIEVLK